MFIIPSDPKENMWNHNPTLIYLKPFSDLYNQDSSKDKTVSSNLLWCITWMCHPDEDRNKYYRIVEEERLQVCKDFEPSFDKNDPLIKDAMDKYPELCLSSIEQSYKLEKDQLIKLTKFLNSTELTLDNAETIIKLKAQMPKIYADFAKTDKEFEKHKSTQRIFGGRTQTTRERNGLIPEED